MLALTDAEARTRRTRFAIARRAAATLVMLCALAARPAPAQTCPADCMANNTVSVAELIRCIGIALGNAAAPSCTACDADGDGSVTVDDLVAGVDAAVFGCPVYRTAAGTCQRPGPQGLEPCAAGSMVRVMRCDNPRTCLSNPGQTTLLDFGPIGTGGAFALQVSSRKVANAALVFEAEVAPASPTTYRLLDFGSLAAGLADESGGGSGLEALVIDPVSEASVEIVDENGLENFAPEAVVEILASVRAANAETTFEGLDPASASTLAMQTAAEDAVVQDAVARLAMTPTPTPTPGASVEIAGEGMVEASSVFGGSDFPAQLAIDGNRGTSWFSNGAAGGPTETFRWTGSRNDRFSAVSILSNREHDTPAFRTFGFASVRVQILDADGVVVFNATRGLPGTTDPDITLTPNVTGRTVLLTFTSHDDPSCGGFSELRISARR